MAKKSSTPLRFTTSNGSQLSITDSFFQHNKFPIEQINKRIGILIVAYNAVTTLAKVLDRIPQDVWEVVEEVIILDDASKDATHELAIGYKVLRGREKLTVIKHKENLGYGGNQKAGYRYFIEKGFDIVVLLHGDGQYAPEIMSQLILPLAQSQAEAVFGSRMMNEYGGPFKGGMPIYKYMGNRILTYLENRLIGLNLTEFHSGYRAYSIEALRQIDFTKMTNDFHFDTEIIIKLQHQGFRIIETPIPTYYGDEICYVNGLRYARNVIRSVLRYKLTARSMECYPEYEEYFNHYPLKQDENSSHELIMNLVGKNKYILDIGCGEGYFAKEIAKKDNRVIGVDILSQPKNISAFEHYLKADLNNGLKEVKDTLELRAFDVILLLDILEHLVNPGNLLKDCEDLLKPNGNILISLPNVANITVRLALLFGKFNYSQRGILDKTHLRFYTRGSGCRFIEEMGYKIIDQKVTILPLELFKTPKNSFILRIFTRLLTLITWFLPDLFGYQNIYIVHPNN
ncbi:MAG: glycosyltransferase [Chloroflexi bacterium]|uniref:Glycosyltransferase n=1 Tax=Candidatus Chlorohelix allophototropha TaxID=3003348 RepID=A0A8T7LX54_9CHLR|nr:glycosyltransferase [Chloroflexota bacterium]WJW65913.1 bifunctional glycosyltransferase/class I SAM-dependent methyltransferase [Chloroflexota bacterium L227-S17]